MGELGVQTTIIGSSTLHELGHKDAPDASIVMICSEDKPGSFQARRSHGNAINEAVSITTRLGSLEAHVKRLGAARGLCRRNVNQYVEDNGLGRQIPGSILLGASWGSRDGDFL